MEAPHKPLPQIPDIQRAGSSSNASAATPCPVSPSNFLSGKAFSSVAGNDQPSHDFLILQLLRERNFFEVNVPKTFIADFHDILSKASNSDLPFLHHHDLRSHRAGINLDVHEERTVAHEALKRLLDDGTALVSREQTSKRSALFAKTLVAFVSTVIETNLEATESSLIAGFSSALHGAITRNLSKLHIGGTSSQREEGAKRFTEMLSDACDREDIMNGTNLNQIKHVEHVCLCCIEMHSAHLREKLRESTENSAIREENAELQKQLQVLSSRLSEAEKRNSELQTKVSNLTASRDAARNGIESLTGTMEKRNRENTWLRRLVEQEQNRRLQNKLNLERLQSAVRALQQLQATKDLLADQNQQLRSDLEIARETVRRLARQPLTKSNFTDISFNNNNNKNAAVPRTNVIDNNRHHSFDTPRSSIAEISNPNDILPRRAFDTFIGSSVNVENNEDNSVSNVVEVEKDPLVDSYIQQLQDSDIRKSRSRPVSGRWAITSNNTSYARTAVICEAPPAEILSKLNINVHQASANDAFQMSDDSTASNDVISSNITTEVPKSDSNEETSVTI